MFYSHTFLARKGPLATVWIAAHLQHRLRKSHYTSTDIPSTVKRIMEPEVPIALRMSGHLLLGVVRIYSKKVDYLFQDCNAVLTGLTKAFASIQLTLPEDARKAPFHSITLPETFDLDALILDGGVDDGVEDIHLRSQEEITLIDQIPTSTDYYVAITFDEDIMMDSSHTQVLPDSGARPMEEVVPQAPSTIVGNVQVYDDPGSQRESPAAQHTDDLHPHNIQDPEFTRDLSSQDAGPRNQTDMLNLSPGDNSPQVLPEKEVLRDANNDLNQENPPPLVPDPGDNAGPSRIFDQTMNDKDYIPPVIEDVDVGELSVPSQRHSVLPTPDISQGAPEAQVSPGHQFPNLVLQPSPPVQQPQKRGRKRKQFFDTSTVLTNKFMKKALDSTDDLLRKRRFRPSSSLDTWKMNNNQRKEQIFFHPLATGLCKDLSEISQRDYICAKSHLVVSEEDHTDDEIARTLSTSHTAKEPRAATLLATACAQDMEIERLRSIAASPPPAIPSHDVETEIINIEGDHSSPLSRNDMTPVSPQKLRSVSVSPSKTIDVAGTVQTPDLASSPRDHGSQMESPRTFLDEGTFQNFVLSDTHHSIISAEEELNFLEADNTPASSQGNEGVNSLSVRTRAVARYLRNLSPISPIVEDPAEDLSLNKILEGKTRKIAARMFFETLVLKSYDLVDVQQEEPYGDVSLKLTAALSKAEI
ncbi:sister chromatid cohesion 1 protein 3-like isoform X1 [Prosopis cineraria]|uniref:sister chromatid cohesion 1 protein 3-like isoform X1 n=1 Tax=Prosopis cineraria TaxID=364024 RepID=UPI0024105A23|nr:sister chromatid cohesion 1 protein 3-like isoform X1 [Prosopis cineraria]